MILAKRSHSNPCFWTALWNRSFYAQFMSNAPTLPHARDQLVYVANIRANKRLQDKVSNIHVEKGVSVAEITPDDAKAFCKRWFPSRYDQFSTDMAGHPETLYLDFESILTGLEGMVPYRVMREVIRTGICDTVDHKAHMASLLVIHFLRSSAILQSSIEISKRFGRPKFEYYWWLKQMLSDTNTLFRLTAPLVFSQWHLYRSDDPVFGLPDTPILLKPQSIMLALSPHLLLEVLAVSETMMDRCFTHGSLHKSKLREYRRRAIANTFKELICATPEVADQYADTYEWKQRVQKVSSNKAACDVLMETDASQLKFLRSFLRFNDANNGRGGAERCMSL